MEMDAERSELVRLMAKAHELQRRLTKLASRLSRLEELIADLEYDFAEFVRQLSGAPRVPRHHGRTRDWEVARRGVSAIDIEPQPGGACRARFDASPPVTLSRGLTRLLHALVRETGGDDDFVGWKAIADVAAELGLPAGERGTRGVLNTRIWRLRKCLVRAGLPAGFVQSHPEKGVRFALRRPAAAAPTATAHADGR